MIDLNFHKSSSCKGGNNSWENNFFDSMMSTLQPLNAYTFRVPNKYLIYRYK